MSLTGKTEQDLDQTVENTGFWPSLALRDFVEQYRLPAEYVEELLIADLQAAMTAVNTMLEPVSNLFDAFTDIDQQTFGNQDGALGDISLHYRRAVFSCARGTLVPKFVTLNRKDAADSAHDDMHNTADYWAGAARASIDYIQAKLLPLVAYDVSDTRVLDGHVVGVI